MYHVIEAIDHVYNRRPLCPIEIRTGSIDVFKKAVTAEFGPVLYQHQKQGPYRFELNGVHVREDHIVPDGVWAIVPQYGRSLADERVVVGFVSEDFREARDNFETIIRRVRQMNSRYSTEVESGTRRIVCPHQQDY